MSNNLKTATSASGNEEYSDQEKKLIKNIIACQQSLTDATYKIGECCDELIEINKGVQYGNQTFKRIAKYKDINCSEQHLRHCWGFYRLTTNDAYQNGNLKELSKRPTAVFSLCRVMDSDLEEKEKVELLNELEDTAIKKYLSVDAINLLVSEKMEEKGLGRKKRATPNPSEPPQKDSAVACEKGFRQYDFLIKTIVKSKDMVNKVTGSQKKCNEIVCRFQNHASLVEQIPNCYKDSELKRQIKDIADRLFVIAGKKR